MSRSRSLAALSFVVVVAGWLVLVAGAPAASAHPLGNFTVNRYAGIVVSPGRVEVRYVVDMAEIPTFQEQPSIDVNGDGIDSPLERKAWADRTARTVASKLTVTVDGSAVGLSVTSDDLRFRDGQAGLPILYFTASFSGSLGSSTGSGSVSYSDGNYQGRIGWKEVTVRSVGGMSVFGSSVPSASVSQELVAYPQDLLSSPLDVTSATFSFRPGPATGAAGAAGHHGPTVSGAPIGSGGAFAGLVRWRLTPVVLIASLLLAVAFGALHALGPGHGKTITAAYLVGSGARVGQAIAVGSAVALMHTASVLALGLVVFVLARSFPAEHIYPWLTLATGVVALVLGAGLFVSRWRGRRRGNDPHPHSHVHPHPHRLAALAVSGGLLPSPTAFVVLTGAINAHRIGYGLSLILAFSVGLAAALIGVGLLALRARSVVATRLRSRWAALIPLGSALVIVGFGVFFAARGLTQVG